MAIHRLYELQRLGPSGPLRVFPAWDNARCWLDEVGHREPETDSVLRAVLEMANVAPDEVWHDIMLFLFWRPLVKCRAGLKRLDSGESTSSEALPAVLDAEILWAFIAALHRINLEARTSCLGQKILNDVQHDVRLSMTKDRKPLAKPRSISAHDGSFDEDDPYALVPGIEDSEYAAVEHRHDATWTRAHLKALVRRGLISGPDYLILIGCYLYDHSLDEMAARLSMTYEAVKKRRQRVLKIVQKNAQSMSPSSGPRPL